MNEVKEIIKAFSITEDERNNFVIDRVVSVLIEWAKLNNEELLESMFTARTFENVKMFQGMYKQNERIISLIEALRGVNYADTTEQD